MTFHPAGDRNHPWQSARDEFDDKVLPILEKHGLEIGQAYKAGDENAITIITYHKMLYRSFDPMTLELLKQAMERYGIWKV